MKGFILVTCFLMLFLPAIAHSDAATMDTPSGALMAEIEAKILAKDFDNAKKLVNSLPGSNWQRDADINDVISYFEALESFRSLVSAPGKTSEAIAAYAPLVNCYNHLPDPLLFSEYMDGFIEGSIVKSERYMNDVCGDDYQNIKVGMKLSRVQQCYGEVFLRGQVKTKNGIVDQYGRGGLWLYVKKGRVIAWGE